MFLWPAQFWILMLDCSTCSWNYSRHHPSLWPQLHGEQDQVWQAPTWLHFVLSWKVCCEHYIYSIFTRSPHSSSCAGPCWTNPQLQSAHQSLDHPLWLKQKQHYSWTLPTILGNRLPPHSPLTHPPLIPAHPLTSHLPCFSSLLTHPTSCLCSSTHLLSWLTHSTTHLLPTLPLVPACPLTSCLPCLLSLLTHPTSCPCSPTHLSPTHLSSWLMHPHSPTLQMTQCPHYKKHVGASLQRWQGIGSFMLAMSNWLLHNT